MGRGWDGKGSTSQWRKVRQQVLERDRYICQINGPRCQQQADTVDHILAKCDGGDDHPSNLRAACAPCNYGKHGQYKTTATGNRIRINPAAKPPVFK